jgi:eukaryotic-like serine/threonine-protein kinase
MPASSWSRAQEILDRLLDEDPALSPQSLDALRRSLGAEPEPVRVEVESLLPHLQAPSRQGGGIADAAPGLLESIAREASATESPTPAQVKAGERLGPWQVIEELGRGGMGVVYLGERADQQFEKRVAIKLLGAPALGAESRRRFLRERQILAELDHPSIARLLDGGVTGDGAPYLVMELVEGEPIDRWCDRTAAGVERRLELFLEVCDAVGAAHEKLVVHRDIKPGNILVTESGHVKLLDFGIAGLIEEAGESPAATVVNAFTPEYASPEQVRLERAGIASDVYSLGVLLYVLLAGRPPYETSGLRPSEVERVVCDVEPPPPSTALSEGGRLLGSRESVRLARRLRGDLDHVALKALAKEISRRYQSVGELGRDVRRSLQGLPVEARPATLGYRARRFAGRHRLAVAASGAIVLSLVAGLALAASQASRAARERDSAMAEAAKARTVSEFLTDLFDQADPFETDEPNIRDLLARGEAKIETELRDHPGPRADLLGAMSRAYLGLGDYPAALRLGAQAVELRRASSSRGAAELIEALMDMSDISSSMGDMERATALAREALELLGTGESEDPAVGMRVHRSLGRYERSRSLEAADEHVQRAIELQRRLTPVASTFLAVLLHDLGALREQQGQADEGLDLKLEALAMHESESEPGNPVVHQMQSNLAITLAGRGLLEEAQRLYGSAISGLEARLGPTHPGLVASLTSFGNLLLSHGRFDEAAPLIERAVAIASSSNLARFDAVGARVNLATLRREQGRLEEALELYRIARQQLRELGIGDDAAPAARVESHIGQTLIRMGRPGEARDRLERALLVQESAPEVRATVVAESQATLGEALCRLDAPGDGLSWIERACSVFARELGEHHWQSAVCAIEHAACEVQLDRHEAAAARLDWAGPVVRERLPTGSYWNVRLDRVREALSTVPATTRGH